MALRIRLTFWFASVATVAVLLLSLSLYAEHGRAVYGELDRSLSGIAQSYAQQVRSTAVPQYSPVASADFDTLVRLYGAAGQPIGVTDSAPPPPLGPIEVLQRNDGPASDPLLRHLPGTRIHVSVGTFATFQDPSTGRRVRLFAMPVQAGGQVVGYVETWNSLTNEDESIARLRALLLGLGGGVLVVLWVGGSAAAGLALRPLHAVTATARAIAESGRLGQRVVASSRHDEIGELTVTFNQMLDVLERLQDVQRRFIADAAHELRAPLAAITGNLELLEHESPPEAAEEATRQLRAAAERMRHVIGQLLVLARLEAGEPARLDDVELDTLLLTTAASIGSAAPGRTIDVSAMEPLVVRGDRRAIEQAIFVLLDNAVKHGKGRISIGLHSEDGQACISVCDEGPGIAAEELPHIFERFYRGARAREEDPQGSGLGLAIARTLLERQGGNLRIASSDAGTCARILLPETVAAA